MKYNFWYTHSQLPADLIITAENETDAERIINLLSPEGDESFKLSSIIDEDGNPVKMDAEGNINEYEKFGGKHD